VQSDGNSDVADAPITEAAQMVETGFQPKKLAPTSPKPGRTNLNHLCDHQYICDPVAARDASCYRRRWRYVCSSSPFSSQGRVTVHPEENRFSNLEIVHATAAPQP
jgi:hypothetical protein